MRTLIAYILLCSTAFASDSISIEMLAIIANANTKHVPVEPTPVVVPKTQYTEVRQVFRQRVVRGTPPTFWNWEGDPSPTHTRAVQHLRTVHRSHLPQHIDVSELQMEDLNRIHSWIHTGGRSLGKWESGPVDPHTGIQIVVWKWTL